MKSDYSEDTPETDDTDGAPRTECPYCENVPGCTHTIATRSYCNADWFGPLVDRSNDLQNSFTQALWLGRCKSSENRILPSNWGPALHHLAEEAFSRAVDADCPENCDWDHLFPDYWTSVAAEVGGCEVVEDVCDDGWCGSCDTYEYIMASNAATTINEIIAFAQADLIRLQEWIRGDIAPVD